MKLYWRVKINGKWTWRPAYVYETDDERLTLEVARYEEEE
jgi:hypothetical protein